MDAHQQKRRKIPWGRWLIVLIALLLIIVGSVLWIADSQGPLINILPAILFTALGVIIALFQWLFPVSSEAPSHATPAHAAHLQPDGVLSAASVPHLMVQVPQSPPPVSQPLSGPLSPLPRAAYRNIIGVPPPTDARTIQQRSKAVQEIYTRLTRNDITAIVLTGIGGVGKSTLAALVYRYAEDQRRAGEGPFTQGALWLKVDSLAVTMTDLIYTIFDALNRPLPDLSSLAPHNQAATLFNALNEERGGRLVVLDQLENLLDWQTGHALMDRPGIGEWLDAINSLPCKCRILLTSRPWPQGTRGYPPTYMQEYHVRGLEISEGVELLRKLHIEATEADLRLAVERCEGHAFALTLLGSLLRNRGLSLGTFFKDPAYARIWTGNVARNLLSHIFSQQLDQIERKLLLAFSVYREPVPLEAACAIADAEQQQPEARIQGALDTLLTQHLLQLQPSSEGYYQPHAIIVRYAYNHFDTSSEEANRQALCIAHERAAAYYQQYAALHCPPLKKRRQLSDVQPLIEAIWHYCQAEQWQKAYALMVEEDIYSDLHRWGSNLVLLELYQLFLPLEQWLLHPSQAPRIYNDLGDVCRTLGQMDQAYEYFVLALSLCEKTRNRREEAWARNNIGRIYASSGHVQQALEYYEEALLIHREGENLGGESTVLTNLGWLYYDMGQMDRARDYYEQALLIRREVKDRKGEGDVLNSLGRVYANLGQSETARDYHEQALHISREVGDRTGEGWALNNLGRVCATLDQKQQARRYFEQALSIRREIGNRYGEGSTLNNLGLLFVSMGEREQAMRSYRDCLLLRREVGNRSGEGKTLNNMGLLYAEMGQYQRARECFQEALRIRRELGHSRRESKTLNNLGFASISLHQYDLALACFLLARECSEKAQDTDARAKPLYEISQRNLDTLSAIVGEEQFVALEDKVAPRAHQLVEEMLLKKQ